MNVTWVPTPARGSPKKMMSPKIAVFGMGNLGTAIAGYMALHGYNVNLWNRTHKKIAVENNRYIRLYGKVAGEAQLNLVTSDYKEAIKDRDVIMLCTTANAHKEVIRKLVPFLQPKHYIMLHPSYMMGAVEVHQLLTKFGLEHIPISEFESSLLTCRSHGIHGNVFAIKEKLGFATLPAHRNLECLNLLKPLFGKYLTAYDNVMQTSMLNLNFIPHTVITLMNAGAIERGERFNFYREGVTPYIAKMIEKTDEERLAVCRLLDVKTFSDKEWTETHYGSYIQDSHEIYESFATNSAHNQVYSPSCLYTRYIWEDIPYGIMPLLSVAKAVNVSTPLLEAIYAISKALFDTNWETEARTLENLGLDSLPKNELMEYIRIGKIAAV
jgi:opine dehydrogenase